MTKVVWDSLKASEKPIVLYGTGNAADRIKAKLDECGINVSGVFASDGFVRNRSCFGLPVTSYADAKAAFKDMTVVLCFGSHREEVLENIAKIDSEQDLYAPDIPVAGGEWFSGEYFDKNEAHFAALRERLADEQSRLVLDCVLEYRKSGKIAPLISCHTKEADNWRLLLGEAPKGPQSLLDLGAYTGDTVELFLGITGGRYSRITAVEPNSRNFRKLSENTANLDNITLIQAAISDADGITEISKSEGRGSITDASKEEYYSGVKEGSQITRKTVSVDTLTIDSIVKDDGIDIIKMDLEGAELAAIKGAERTIRMFKPRMLVSAYHKTDDILALYGKVLEIEPSYKVYLRKDPCIPGWGISYYFI